MRSSTVQQRSENGCGLMARNEPGFRGTGRHIPSENSGECPLPRENTFSLETDFLPDLFSRWVDQCEEAGGFGGGGATNLDNLQAFPKQNRFIEFQQKVFKKIRTICTKGTNACTQYRGV